MIKSKADEDFLCVRFTYFIDFPTIFMGLLSTRILNHSVESYSIIRLIHYFDTRYPCARSFPSDDESLKDPLF